MNSAIRYPYILILISYVLFTNFQCNDCDKEIFDNSSYTANILPLKTSYSLGDTISVGTSISSDIELTESGSIHDHSNQMVQFAVQIFEVNPNNELVTKGIERFDMISRIGQITEVNFSLDIKLAKEILNTCGNELCEFRIDLIPKTKGIFCISLLNSRILESECKNLDFLNNDFGLNDNNFSICQEINTVSFRLLEGGPFFSNPEEISGFYFFKVD